MGLPTPGTNKLSVLRAVEDGWQAFCRAPWPFVLFQVLVLLIMAPFIGLISNGLLQGFCWLRCRSLTQQRRKIVGIQGPALPRGRRA